MDPYLLEVRSTDLTRYSEKGIFVTTGDSPKNYESVALLRAYCFDGMVVTDTIDRRRMDDSFGKREKIKMKKCNENEVIDHLVNSAISKGANGVIKLNIEYVTIPRSSGSNKSFIVVSGLAVRYK